MSQEIKELGVLIGSNEIILTWSCKILNRATHFTFQYSDFLSSYILQQELNDNNVTECPTQYLLTDDYNYIKDFKKSKKYIKFTSVLKGIP